MRKKEENDENIYQKDEEFDDEYKDQDYVNENGEEEEDYDYEDEEDEEEENDDN